LGREIDVATPWGHLLAGVAAGSAASGGRSVLGPWRDLVFFGVVAVLPDLDFLPGLLLGGGPWHQGPTHSLLAAALATALCGLWGRRYGQGWLLAWCGAAVYLSHLAVDFCTVDTLAPIGLPLFWPFSPEHVTAKHAIFLDVKRRGLSWAVLAHDLKALAWETLLLGPWAGLALWLRVRRRAKHPLTGEA